MDEKNRVKIKICGNDFYIAAEDSEEYIRMIGELVDSHIHKLMEQNPRMSTMMASIFTSMDLCDEAFKAKETADHLRAQIKEYLDEAALARDEADQAKQDLEKAERELAAIRGKYGIKEDSR